jgi:hypothetical protein
MSRARLWIENTFGVYLCEAFLLCRFFFFRHYSFAEVRLRCRNPTSEGQVDTDIAHRHLGPGECAEYHQIVEIP